MVSGDEVEGLSEAFGQVRVEAAHLEGAADGAAIHEEVYVAVVGGLSPGVGAEEGKAGNAMGRRDGDGDGFDLIYGVNHGVILRSWRHSH